MENLAMNDFFSKLTHIEATDGPGGIVGLNYALNRFAGKRPVAALAILGVLFGVIVYLTYRLFS